MSASITAGLTADGPLKNRPNDSIGFGIAWASINRNSDFLRAEYNPNELMLQGYAQIALTHSLYFQPTITMLPLTGVRDATPDSVSGLLQLTMLC